MIKAWWIWTQMWSMATDMGVWTPAIDSSDPSQVARLFKPKSMWYILMRKEELNRKWIIPGRRHDKFWSNCETCELGRLTCKWPLLVAIVWSGLLETICGCWRVDKSEYSLDCRIYIDCTEVIQYGLLHCPMSSLNLKYKFDRIFSCAI